MEIQKIYMDMDGVLADFDDGIRRLCFMEPQPQNAIQSQEYEDEMWDRIRKVGHFYGKLQPMPGAVDMFRKLYEKYGNRVEILTGIPRPERGIIDAAADKREWVKRLLSEDVVVHTVRRKDKKNYCKGKDFVLIDDFDKNTREWDAMGGSVILYTDPEKALRELAKIEAGD
ncbi:MAG: hypothetical protein IKR58_02525 [Lachnospiraceae bacterium]|nr:hypothetical protein [Lachnospiraceae bacterium]